MTPRDPGRRHFLAIGLAAVGAAIAAPVVWVRSRAGGATATLDSSSSTAAATTRPPTTRPPTTTAPPATTSRPVTTTRPASTTTEPPEPTSTTATPGPPPVVIEAICVAGWGGQPAQGEFEEHVIERLTVHHTAARLDDNTRAPHHVRGHQRFHQRDRGWPDLAYHFVVDRNGHVYQGRPLWARGDTGTTYDPKGHFLVSCEGDFDDQAPSDAQIESLVSVLAWASAEFGVDPATMRGHRDWAATTCPGENLYPSLADGTLLAAVEEEIVARPPELLLICGDEAEARVADIEAGVI